MRTIFKIVAVAILGVTLQACGGGGGPSAVDDCNQLNVILCQKFYQCFTSAQLASDPQDFGTSEADCVRIQQASSCTPAMVACDSGKTYNSANAQSCLVGVKALTCTDLTQTNIPMPPACDQVCM